MKDVSLSDGSVTPGSGVVLLSTEWNQSSEIPGSTIHYNEYCPTDPLTQIKCKTGCTNTAAAQILYYWIENSDLDFSLQLNEDDAYISEYEGRTISIDATEETAQNNGYLSFAKTNQLLKTFTVGDAADIAALCFATGVVQKANYSSDATSTAYDVNLFYRSGFDGCTTVGCFESVNFNPYFYIRTDDKVRITDAGYEVIIHELLSGRPIATSYPGHRLVFDGYDAATDKFHINYGWSVGNGWFSKEEIYERQFYCFDLDIMPSYDGSPITVTNSAAYGVGTFLRGIEQLQGIRTASTLTVRTTGNRLELERKWNFDKEITINNFNSEVYFKACSYGLKSSADVTFNGFSGQIHTSQTGTSSATALYTTENFYINDFTGSLTADSEVYASGVDCSSLAMNCMAGTISARSASGSVFGIRARKNDVNIDQLAGLVSSASGTYTSYGIYAAETIDIGTLSGSVYGKSDSSSASGIYANGAVSIDNVSGCVTAYNAAERNSFAIRGYAMTVQNFSGVSIAASTGTGKSVYGIYVSTDALNFRMNDGSIYAGVCATENDLFVLQKELSAYGEKGILAAMPYNQNVFSKSYAILGSNQDDVILAKNHSMIQGRIYLNGGNDKLSVLGSSYVYAPGIDIYGTGTLTVDSSSTVSGVFFGTGGTTSITINMIISSETKSDAMIVLQKYCGNFYIFLKDKTLNIDLRAAVDGEYVLVDAAGLDKADYLKRLSAEISTGSQTFTLKCGESANHVSLKYENEKLILVLENYALSAGGALLFDDEELLSVTESISDRKLSLNGADSLRLTAGGTAKNIEIGTGGDMQITNHAEASDTVIQSGGMLEIESHGCAFNTTVQSGGVLNIGESAVHSGSLQIAENGIVHAEDTAEIHFALEESSAQTYTGINDFSRIDGTPEFYVSVSGSQMSGEYTLAGKAESFRQTITVTGLTNPHELDLNTKQSFSEGGKTYSLTLDDDDDLIFTVSAPKVNAAKGDIDGNGVSDVMFQYTGGDYQIGFWMNGSSTWKGTAASQPDTWELLGNYDMDSNGKADQVMVGNVEVSGVKGAYIGFYKDGDTTANGWQNIGYLSNSENITWDNAVGNLTGNAGANSIVWHAPELGALGVWTDGTANWVSLGSTYNNDWVMQGCGDFDGNGKDEVLFTYGGNLYSIDIDGNFAALGQGVNGWEVRAIGDFSGDGQDDIVLFHTETGSVMKFENGTTYQSLGQLDASDWFIAGCGDYNNDQKDDLLVRQYSTGMLGYYESGNLSNWVELGRGIDSNWTIVA